MRIFISVDIEGVAGVGGFSQGYPGNPEYEMARRLMTEEANAAIRGAFEGGATEVTVADSHGPMRNMIAEELDPRARVVSGTPRRLSMIDGLDADHAGLVLIGWHAAAGRPGVLAHTVSGQAFSRIEINGVRAGEATLFAGYAAEIGVPLIAVSGDDRLALEIAEQFPSTSRIEVKQALGGVACNSLSPSKARRLIQTEVSSAVSGAAGRTAEAPCMPPLLVEVSFVRQHFADVAELVPGVTRREGWDVSFESASHAEVIGLITVFSILGAGLM